MAKGRIEAGWHSFREKVIPPSASVAQVAATQAAYYAGASFLLAQMMLALDTGPGNEPTDGDLAMMDGIHEELVAFARAQRG